MNKQILSIIDAQPGFYTIQSITNNSKSFNNSLKAIGFIQGALISILRITTKCDLYIRINEKVYFLRKKSLNGVFLEPCDYEH